MCIEQVSCSKGFLCFPGYAGSGQVRISRRLFGISESIFSTVDDIVVNQLFGVNSGLGMGILTFDWAQISWVGSPLMIPWWAEVNIMIGFVLVYWIIGPIVYYTNVGGQCLDGVLGLLL